MLIDDLSNVVKRERFIPETALDLGKQFGMCTVVFVKQARECGVLGTFTYG